MNIFPHTHIYPKHIDALVPSEHDIKTSITVEMKLSIPIH